MREIRPEAALLDQVVEPLIRRHDETKVGQRVARRANRSDDAGLHGAKQLGLMGQRQSADLVEKHRAAVRLAKKTGCLSQRAGERALCMTK